MKGNEYMNPTSRKRDISILIKVTPQEKEQIVKNAEAFGGSVSEFIRHRSLSLDDGSPNGSKKQAVVRELCRLSELTKISDADQLRRNLKEWSENIWLYMK